MKILVMDRTAKVFSVECESTDTIAHLNAKLGNIKGIHQSLMFDGKRLNDNFLENMMLVDVGIQDGSLILHSSFPREFQPSSGGLRRPENDYLHYADAFKSGWREEHAKSLLHFLLELCQDGTISEGNVTDEAWLRVQNSLRNSMKCSFQIDFLKERLCDYKQLYLVLAETTSSLFFEWDRERKIITIDDFFNWREEYPELLLLCGGPHIPYFDTLEEVCLLVKTTRSSEQRVAETSTNINNAQESCSPRGEICIRRPSDSYLTPISSSTLIGEENRYLPSTLKILVVDETAKVFSVECESTDTIGHLKAKLDKITGLPFREKMTITHLMFDGKHIFLKNMMLVDAGVQDGSLILHSTFPQGFPLPPLYSGQIDPPRIPGKDYLYYADVLKSGWSEEHAKELLHLLLKLCQDGTISEGNVTGNAWFTIQNSLKNSTKCSFQIDFLKERLCDYKQLYSVLTYRDEYTDFIFVWDRETKTITTMNDDWREDYPELLLLRGNYISYFDTLENVCSLLNTGQSSRREFQNPILSKFKSLFSNSQRS